MAGKRRDQVDGAVAEKRDQRVQVTLTPLPYCSHPFNDVGIRIESYIALLRHERVTLFCNRCGHTRKLKRQEVINGR